MVKSKSIVNATIQVTVAMFFIKFLGVAKQSIIAAVCGATSGTDAYFIASGVITALCTVVFSSISISLLSMHTDRLIKEGRESSNNLINSVLRVFVPISVLIAVLFAVFSPVVAKCLAPSYEGVQLQTLSDYIRVMSLMFVFTCYSLIVNVTIETDKRFLPGKGQSFFQNLFIVLATVLFFKKVGIIALIYAFLLAGFVQCIQVTWSARNIFRFKRKITLEKESISKLIYLAVPLLIGNAIYEINDIVDKQISSGLGFGSVSVLSYGASINEIVTTLIIGSVSTVLFSHYATWVSSGKIEKVEKNLKSSLEYLLVIIMPIMAMCFVCGDCIVDILYGRGNFDTEAITRTSGVVMGYAAGFFFQAARANIVKVFYAFQDTKTPMINGAISVATNICMSIIFSKHIGSAGIALATSIAMLLVTILLLPQIRKYIPGFNLNSSFPEYLKSICAAIIIGSTAYVIRAFFDFGTWISFFVIGTYIVMGYLALLLMFKSKCIRVVIDKIKGRLQYH